MTGRRTGPARAVPAFAAACGFLAGMAVMAALIVLFPDQTGPARGPAERAPVEVRPTPVEEPSAVTPLPPAADRAGAVAGADPIADLLQRRLDLPVKGATRDEVTDGFNEVRGGSRRHEAIDLLAPRHTPVVAVEDGTIARLFFSAAGGITVYQFDPTTSYVYYYAHLDRYAEGLAEGVSVVRGQVLGYVGTTGNAAPDTPHLHFAIFKLDEKKQWWQGLPIDPFHVLRGVER